MDNFVTRFFTLKKSGFSPDKVLDIGAYRGEFTNMVKAVWPDVDVYQFDADERNKKYLQDDAVVAVLGDEERSVSLYTIEDTGWGSTTGTSIFKENTPFYANATVNECHMTTLDSHVDLGADWSNSLIKIDTQGSELNILRGAKQLLSKKPRYIILECSRVEYNQGAPLINEVFEYMKSAGYKPVEALSDIYVGEQLIQSDWLFEPRDCDED